MGFMDKILDVMSLNVDDEDDFDNEDYYLEDEPEEAPRKFFGRKDREKEEEPVISSKKEPVVKEKPVKPVSKITPISKSSRKQGTAMQVCVIKPTSIEDEIEITDTLLNGKTVVINMEGLDVDMAQRIIDFTSGSTYALQGNLQKISNYIFLATPNGVDISGDFSSIMDSITGATL